MRIISIFYYFYYDFFEFLKDFTGSSRIPKAEYAAAIALSLVEGCYIALFLNYFKLEFFTLTNFGIDVFLTIVNFIYFIWLDRFFKPLISFYSRINLYFLVPLGAFVFATSVLAFYLYFKLIL